MRTMALAVLAARARRGLPSLRQGIGVHFGPAGVGNEGTTERASYTVVGDTVNLASRLELSTKEIGADTLVSEQAVISARACPGDAPLSALESLGPWKVQGREQPVTVYRLAVG